MGTLHLRRTFIASTAHSNSAISSTMALRANREVIMTLIFSARGATSNNDRTIIKVLNESSNRKMNGRVPRGKAIKDSGMQIKNNKNSINENTSKRECGEQKSSANKKKLIANGPDRKRPLITTSKISDARDTR
jgi:hypothetical protein